MQDRAQLAESVGEPRTDPPAVFELGILLHVYHVLSVYWAEAEAKAEARYGLPFLETKTAVQRKQLVEDEYRRLHNGSLDEDKQTHHWGDSAQE